MIQHGGHHHSSAKAHTRQFCMGARMTWATRCMMYNLPCRGPGYQDYAYPRPYTYMQRRPSSLSLIETWCQRPLLMQHSSSCVHVDGRAGT